MKVRVKLFAAAKELAGRNELTIDVPTGATVADLRRSIVAAVPAFENIIRHSLWAVDADYVRDDTQLSETSDIALIPPVSGG